MRVLIVEDDDMIASGLRTAFERAHHTVEHTPDGDEGLSLAKSGNFDLMILDLGLPSKDGIEVLRALRSSKSDLAVIILSARDKIADRIQGLDIGADDYLVKPFELEELLARARVLERRRANVASNTIQRGPLLLNLDAMTVSWQNANVDLPRREWMLLRLLAESPSRVFSRDQIERALYGVGENTESNAIDVHVHHLRRKLHSEIVQTVRGVGYRFGNLN
ncbi:MAG: response regulator transcription factor [Burkholderiaceae bacterium]|nr:response regulator transcription factor [Burkholderiaceae bacterium]